MIRHRRDLPRHAVHAVNAGIIAITLAGTIAGGTVCWQLTAHHWPLAGALLATLGGTALGAIPGWFTTTAIDRLLT